MIYSRVEEYHPRWGARTSNPVKSVYSRLGGFDSCLFRHPLLKTSYLCLASNDSAKNPLFLLFSSFPPDGQWNRLDSLKIRYLSDQPGEESVESLRGTETLLNLIAP